MMQWIETMLASPWGAAAFGYIVGYSTSTIQNIGQRQRASRKAHTAAMEALEALEANLDS